MNNATTRTIGHVRFCYSFGCGDNRDLQQNGDEYIGHVTDNRHKYLIGSLFIGKTGGFYVVTADRLKTIRGRDLTDLELRLRKNH